MLFRLCPDLLRAVAGQSDVEGILALRWVCRASRAALSDKTAIALLRKRLCRPGEKLYLAALSAGQGAVLGFLRRSGYRFEKRVVQQCVRRTTGHVRLQLCRYLLSLGYAAYGLQNALAEGDLALVRLLSRARKFSERTMRFALWSLVCTERPDFLLLHELLSVQTLGRPYYHCLIGQYYLWDILLLKLGARMDPNSSRADIHEAFVALCAPTGYRSLRDLS